MFEFNSRYASSEEKNFQMADGRLVRYKRRRLIPRVAATTTLPPITTQPADRPDLMAGRHLGDSTQFWRLADTNGIIDPWEMGEKPGQRLHPPGERPLR